MSVDHVAEMEKVCDEEQTETAKELIAKTADAVTLDEFMLRHPSKLGLEERLQLVEIQRRDRARFALGEGKRKGRKS